VSTILSVIGPTIAALGFVPYLKGVIHGSVRPRVASWATWSLVTGVATFAALSKHAYTSALLTAVATCFEVAILVIALRRGDHDYNWVDGVSQAISLLGVVAWLSTSHAVWAIVFAIAADFFGAIPTFYHSWIAPHDESWVPFILSGVGGAVSFLGVSDVGVVSAGFPLYVCLIGPALGLNIIARQRAIAA
jgi:hypothetical protein